jgi:hypothetical protein
MKAIHWLGKEFKKVGILALFFTICFVYIFIVMNLFLKTYSIDTYGISKVIVGFLFAAKAILILDKTPFINQFKQFPRYVHLFYKTLLYTTAVALMGILEGMIHGYGETHQWGDAFRIFLETKNLNSYIATNLCVGVVFFIYSTFNNREGQ